MVYFSEQFQLLTLHPLPYIPAVSRHSFIHSFFKEVARGRFLNRKEITQESLEFQEKKEHWKWQK